MPPDLFGQLVHYLVDRRPVISNWPVEADGDRLSGHRQRRFSRVTIVAMIEREAELTPVRRKVLEELFDQRHGDHPLAASDFRPLFAGNYSLVE